MFLSPKTGLTSGSPSLVLLMVAANAGLVGMSKEHLAIALALTVPVAVCITKVREREIIDKQFLLESVID
jgi:GTPase